MSEINTWPEAIAASVMAICFAVPASIFIYQFFKTWDD